MVSLIGLVGGQEMVPGTQGTDARCSGGRCCAFLILFLPLTSSTEASMILGVVCLSYSCDINWKCGPSFRLRTFFTLFSIFFLRLIQFVRTRLILPLLF